MNGEFLRPKQAAQLLGVGRTKFWMLSKEPDFPSAIRLGARLKVWAKRELEAWALSRRARP